MHRFKSQFFLAVWVAGTACLAGSQNSTTSNSNCNDCRPRARHPYTAEFKITQVRTLANGSTVTQESTEVQAIDSQGRRLTSTTTQTAKENQPSWTRTHVSGPEGSEMSWDSRTRTVRVINMPPHGDQNDCWANDSGTTRISRYQGPRPGIPAPNGTVLSNGSTIVPAVRHTPQIEDLGTTTIEGIEVHGERFTTIIPQGEDGNDQPIVIVSEHWTSPQLEIVLRELNDDPRSGKRTREVTSLNLGDPDPSLFQPPNGYEVTTEELHQVTCPSSR